jgi:hypothetical protein
MKPKFLERCAGTIFACLSLGVGRPACLSLTAGFLVARYKVKAANTKKAIRTAKPIEIITRKTFP